MDNGNVSNKTYISMINTLMEENKELKNFVIDQSKETRKIVDKVMEIQPHTTINNNTPIDKTNIVKFKATTEARGNTKF